MGELLAGIIASVVAVVLGYHYPRWQDRKRVKYAVPITGEHHDVIGTAVLQFARQQKGKVVEVFEWADHGRVISIRVRVYLAEGTDIEYFRLLVESKTGKITRVERGEGGRRAARRR